VERTSIADATDVFDGNATSTATTVTGSARARSSPAARVSGPPGAVTMTSSDEPSINGAKDSRSSTVSTSGPIASR